MMVKRLLLSLLVLSGLGVAAYSIGWWPGHTEPSAVLVGTGVCGEETTAKPRSFRLDTIDRLEDASSVEMSPEQRQYWSDHHAKHAHARMLAKAKRDAERNAAWGAAQEPYRAYLEAARRGTPLPLPTPASPLPIFQALVQKRIDELQTTIGELLSELEALENLPLASLPSGPLVTRTAIILSTTSGYGPSKSHQWTRCVLDSASIQLVLPQH